MSYWGWTAAEQRLYELRYHGAKLRRAKRAAESAVVARGLKLSQTRLMLPQVNIKTPRRHVRVLHHG